MKQALFTLTLFILLLVPCFAQKQSKLEEDKPSFRDPFLLIEKIDSNGTLSLNEDGQTGAIELIERLSELFSRRQEGGVYSKEMEDRVEVPEFDRVAKAVWILAAPNLDSSSVAEVINAVKLAGASPVKMLTEEDYQRYLDERRFYDEMYSDDKRRRHSLTAPENPLMQRKGKVRSKKTKPLLQRKGKVRSRKIPE